MSSRRFRRSSFSASHARNIRKSVSCEPLMDLSSSEDEDRGGGARLSTCSLTPSPAGKQLMFQSNSTLETGGSPGSSSNSFQVGANSDDDVFASHESSIPSFGSNATLVHRPKHTATGHTPFDMPIITSHGPPRDYDAQDHYPHSACIFVANLFQGASDPELEYEVTRVFSQFGSVYVKIKRDHRRGMPHAFCQFTSVRDAERAERDGKGIVILGRPCRTEMARAQATFVVSKISGQPTYDTEALRLLEPLGAIAKAERLPTSIQRQMGLPPAIIITFQMYDTQRDVVGTFRGHKSFRVAAYDPRFATAEGQEHEGTSPLVTSHSSRHAKDAMADYDKDRRSAYMGNLPCNMTADRLDSIVSACGAVLSIELKRKAIPDIHEKFTCFAFIEYDRPDSADTLVRTLNHANIDGQIVRVSRKESRTFRGPPSVKNETLRPRYSTQGAFARHKPRSSFNRPHARDIFKSFEPDEDEHSRSPLAKGYENYSQEPGRLSSEENHCHESTGHAPQASTPGGNARNLETLDTPRPRDVQETSMSPPFTMPHFSSPHPYMPWMPSYSPHSFAPVSPYSPIPAQGAPTMMYPGVFSSPLYPGMYHELFGIYSPIPAMGPTVGGEEAASGHNTPTRPSQEKGAKETAEAEKEMPEEEKKANASP